MYILTNDVDSRRTFEIKAKTMSALKRPIFLVTLIQAVVSKMLRLFYKIILGLQNITTLDITRSRDKWGVLSFGKRPGSLRVKGRNTFKKWSNH